MSNNKHWGGQNRHKFFHVRGEEARLHGCVYCKDTGHKALQGKKVTNSCQHKKILAKKGLLHCASTLSKCHHSSICDKQLVNAKNQRKLLTDRASDDRVFPVVVLKVNGIMW